MNPLVAEKKENLPILVVDKEGIIGERIAEKLAAESPVVFVSDKEPKINRNIIYIPLLKKIPVIPDNQYSHIFVFDDQEPRLKEMHEIFLHKAISDGASFVLISHVVNNEQLFRNKSMDYKNTKLVLFGDIFPNISGAFSSFIVNRFLSQARNRGKIEVPEDGMQLAYPVYLNDLITGILEAAFGSSQNKVFYLFPQHGVTLLSLAHMIHKVNPEVRIDFGKKVELPKVLVSESGAYLLGEDYPLAQRIRSLNLKIDKFEKQIYPQTIERRGNKSESSKTLKALIFTVVFFIFLPLFSTILFTFLGLLFFDSSKLFSLENSRPNISMAQSLFEIANNTSKVLSSETSFLGINSLDQLFAVIEEGNKSTKEVTGFYKTLDLLREGKTQEAIPLFKNFLLFEQSEKLNNKKSLKLDENIADFSLSTIDKWDEILGSRRNFLILFQNNRLKGAGGEVGAFATADLENGKVENIDIHNSITTEEKLKGFVEPPFPLRRYGKISHWYIKDSSFNPDFREAASSAAFFATLETGKNFDGVISLDSKFSEQILNEPQILTDEETLRKLVSKLKQNSPNLFFSKAVGEALRKKDIAFAFFNPDLERDFTVNGYSSSIWDGREDQANKLNDYLGLIDTNLGDKSNIIKSVSQSVAVGDSGEIKTSLVLKYENKSQDLKNYVRIILPPETSIENIKIDSEEKKISDAIKDPNIYEAKDFSSKETEVDKNIQEKKLITGFYLESPKGTPKTVEINYSYARKFDQTTFSYDLKIFKQQGGEDYPYELSLSYPKSYSPINFPKGAFKEEGKATYKINVDSDKELNFDFSQK